MIENYNFRATFIANQVFFNTESKQTVTFTQFALERNDGCKMAVALHKDIFKNCVKHGKTTKTYEPLPVEDILLLANRGILLSGKNLVKRKPGSVMWAMVMSENSGFSRRIKKKECYHNFNLGNNWKLVDCRPCFQRHRVKFSTVQSS